MGRHTKRAALGCVGLLMLCVAGTGCLSQGPLLTGPNRPVNRPPMHAGRWAGSAPVVMPDPGLPTIPDHGLPTEKQKVTHPEYMLEVPDILLIDVIRAIPRGPYRIQPLDALAVNTPQALREEPIAGVYPIGPEGRVNLGLNYGSVAVADLTVEEAEEAIRQHLATLVPKPKVTVSLAGIGAIQQIRGEHIINPDGTVRLGTYGSVYVAGMTLDEARAVIESHLSAKLVRPEVSMSVYAYNSKFYYVITDGGGYGEQVFRFPATGNETVLDALSMINGLPVVASKKHIWLARPAPPNWCQPDQILPVDWNAIARAGNTRTNYQVLPGDRVYVMARPGISASSFVARVLEPVERILGVTLLGGATVQVVQGNGFGR